MNSIYIAQEGRVLVCAYGEIREAHSALTANGDDVEQFERAREAAKRQRDEHAEQLASLTGVVEPLDAA